MMMKNLWFTVTLLLSTIALGAGKIQDADVKSAAELATAGAPLSALINDTKIYVTANSINQQLSTAITSGLIGGGGGGAGINLLKNPGFETGLTNYTNTGGTLSPISSGASLLIGNGSATFQASGSGQSMQSALYPVPNGLFATNCAAQILYLGGDQNLFLEVTDGTNIFNSVELPPVSRPTYASLPFICPSSGSLQIEIVSLASTAIIALDQFYLGQNVISEFNSASYFGGVTSDNSGFQALLAGPAASYTDLGSGTSGTTTLSGAVSSFAVTNGAVTVDTMPPGDYDVRFEGACSCNNLNSATGCIWAITDGTTYNGNTSFDGQINPSGTTPVIANASVPCTLVGHFNYTTAGSRTFKVQVMISGSTTAGFGVPSSSEFFSIYRFPTAVEGAVNPATINWLVDVSQQTSTAINLSFPQTTFAEVTDSSSALVTTANTNSLPVQVPCSGTNPSTGLTCSAGTPDVGLVFNLPAPGSVRACVTFPSGAGPGSGAMTQIYDIAETPNNAQTILQQTMSGNYTQLLLVGSFNTYDNNVVCGFLNFTTAGQKTLRLVYKASLFSGTSSSNGLPIGPPASAHWIITPITQNIPAPVTISPQNQQELYFTEWNNYGSTDTGVIGFLNTLTNNGNAMSFVTNAANGTVVTINQAGLYSISAAVPTIAGGYPQSCVISRNATTLTAAGSDPRDGIDPTWLAASEATLNTTIYSSVPCSRTTWLNQGDLIRLQTTAQQGGSLLLGTFFSIVKIL